MYSHVYVHVCFAQYLVEKREETADGIAKDARILSEEAREIGDDIEAEGDDEGEEDDVCARVCVCLCPLAIAYCGDA